MLFNKVKTKLNQLTPFLRQCYVTAAVSINVTGFAFPTLLHNVIIYNQLSDSLLGIALAVSGFIGIFLCVPLLERVGWKLADYIASTVAVIVWMLACFLYIPEVVFPAKIISVVSFGLLMSLRSILIAECTSPKNRGAFLTTISLIQGCGFLILHMIRSLDDLFKIIIVCIAFLVLSFSQFMFIPQSPSWLITKGKYDESRKIFRWFRGDEEESELDAMIRARKKFDEEYKHTLDIISHIKKREFYKPIILMLHLYAITWFSGAAIITAYTEKIIQLLTHVKFGFDWWITGLYAEIIVVSVVAIVIINKINRRTMVLASTGMCIVTLIIIAAYNFFRSSSPLPDDCLWIPGILMVLHIFTISIGTVPLPIVIAGEVFPMQFRSMGLYISMISTTVNMCLSLEAFPVLVDSIGISGTYAIYASCLTYCLIVVWFLLPETNGKTLQDIEKEYRGKVTETNNEEIQTLNSNPEDKNIGTIWKDAKAFAV